MLYKLDEKEILLEYIESERYEASKEAVIRMLEGGQLSVEQIAGYFSNITVDDVNRIKSALLQND